ncbi:MAG: hypothetical protein F4X44_09405 [Gammaproteobacteria bacterium]|nr:hypothetical protein [Gammaproteobacteria bacterium]MYD80815.1 hypothetical protein [Gammaproteobacteria bacterium]
MGNPNAGQCAGRLRVCIFSDGLSREDRELTAVRMAESLDEGIRFALCRAKSTSVAVIPEGPYVVPQLTMEVTSV